MEEVRIEGEEFFEKELVSNLGYIPVTGLFVGIARTVYGIGMSIFNGAKALGSKIKGFFCKEVKEKEDAKAAVSAAKARRSVGHILRGLAEIPSIFGFPLFVHDIKFWDSTLLVHG